MKYIRTFLLGPQKFVKIWKPSSFCLAARLVTRGEGLQLLTLFTAFLHFFVKFLHRNESHVFIRVLDVSLCRSLGHWEVFDAISFLFFLLFCPNLSQWAKIQHFRCFPAWKLLPAFRKLRDVTTCCRLGSCVIRKNSSQFGVSLIYRPIRPVLCCTIPCRRTLCRLSELPSQWTSVLVICRLNRHSPSRYITSLLLTVSKELLFGVEGYFQPNNSHHLTQAPPIQPVTRVDSTCFTSSQTAVKTNSSKRVTKNRRKWSTHVGNNGATHHANLN